MPLDDAYGPLSPVIPFAASIQHEEAAINHAGSIPEFDHGHGHENAASRHPHLEGVPLHLDAPQLTRQHELTFRPSAPQELPRAPHLQSQIQQPVPDSAFSAGFDMLPPPQGPHPTWQALHDFAQLHASAHGYALSINTTAKNRSRIKLACVCYGAPKNTHKLTPETRVRKNRASYKTGCKMWVEGKRQEDGTWLLRVGEGLHNHPGRSAEGWAVQRKRTWGVQGGRIGMGGVTAKEERERMGSIGHDAPWDAGHDETTTRPNPPHRGSHSLESGGLVWKIVEQEMLRKRAPGQGRDRGVGRTVKMLEERLPGIQIFKRDVYNIRAQIKRARKAAGQELGEGLDSEEEDEDAWQDGPDGSNELAQPDPARNSLDDRRSCSEIDPTLVAQCSDALKKVTRQESESEAIALLRKENDELRGALTQRTKELGEKDAEIERLRGQLGLANMALYSARGGQIQ